MGRWPGVTRTTWADMIPVWLNYYPTAVAEGVGSIQEHKRHRRYDLRAWIAAPYLRARS